MEKLFSANLVVINEKVVYEVSFANEQYEFIPKDSHQQNAGFAIKREGDEWHETSYIPEDIKKQAIDALDKYLLAQH